MSKIIACIDGSAYADSVSHFSAWAHERTGLGISLLHVVAPHSEMQARSDMTGQIGVDAKSNLLEKLTKLDEEHGKLELRKGLLMLEHAKDELVAKGVSQPEVLHRRGSLVETISELESQVDLIVMGKRGEHHHAAPAHLGSNLERVARAIHKPLLVVTPEAKPVKKFLIAYDGSESADKAVAYAASNALLKGLECHLLKVGETLSDEAQEMLNKAKEKLSAANITAHTSFKQGRPVQAMVSEYIQAHSIDLLLIGAYGHSKIRSLILGSNTTALIRECDVPVMLFR